MPLPIDNRTEWLEADGLGGFASGTTCGERTRRYHALLLAAAAPPTGRMVLVSGFDAWVETPAGRFALSSQRYHPDVVWPDGAARIADFTIDPWPTWTYAIANHGQLVQELFVPKGSPACGLRWRWQAADELGQKPAARLLVRPLISGRDYHALHHENPVFCFDATEENGWLRWQPYSVLPAIFARTNGIYTHDPEWFRNFLYIQERERGLDDAEDLGSPGVLSWDLSAGAILIFAAGDQAHRTLADPEETVHAAWERLEAAESMRRRAFATSLHRSADAYLVQRGAGKTIVAGYPWFTDWGRDTFIALRGLCLTTGRFADARDILLAWSETVSEGMLPNRFPDFGDTPEYNSVDASLWYIIAVHDLLAAAPRPGSTLSAEQRAALQSAVSQIVEGYARGTRYGIRADSDGLLACGEPGTQITWMDAKHGDEAMTSRVGKPVEVQALWLNALWIAGRTDTRWMALFERGRTAFEKRFWNAALDCLYDVIDVDHRPEVVDISLRPNQIFAVGGLPLALLHGEKARNVVDAVESRLLTPLGLRTLASGSPNYHPTYTGGPRDRDAAYHQGTVWPWLLGPFLEAWLRVRSGTAEAKAEARTRFLPPLLAHLHTAGLGHLSEILDADPPHTPRGCPFQAWSLGEFLRVVNGVLESDPER